MYWGEAFNDERGIRIDCPCEDEDNFRITPSPSPSPSTGRNIAADDDDQNHYRHGHTFMEDGIGNHEERLTNGLDINRNEFKNDLDQALLSLAIDEQEQEQKNSEGVHDPISDMRCDEVTILAGSLYPRNSLEESRCTSSSDVSASNLSLAFSTICTSISSLFSSNPDDPTQSLAQSTTSLSSSASASSSIIPADDSEINKHRFGLEAVTEERKEQDSDSFPPDTFLNVARRLAAQDSILPGRARISTSSTASSFDSDNAKNDGDTMMYSPPTPIEWWMDYTEEDWDNFALLCRDVLEVLEPEANGNRKNKLPLPPSPPPQPFSCQTNATDEGSNHTQHPQLHQLDHSIFKQLMDTFQPEFICAICQQLIIGATTLDCGCEKATVCTSCIEYHDDVKKDQSNDIIDDYVMVSLALDDECELKEARRDPYEICATTCTSTGVGDASKTCPSCHTLYDRHIPCHALDVAILDAVKNLPMTLPKRATNTNNVALNPSGEDVEAFQSIFYMRLLLWRQEVIRRQAALLREYDHKQQLLLSRLIQREERVFGTKCKERRAKEERKKRHILMEMSMFAVFALLGFAFPRCGRR